MAKVICDMARDDCRECSHRKPHKEVGDCTDEANCWLHDITVRCEEIE